MAISKKPAKKAPAKKAGASRRASLTSTNTEAVDLNDKDAVLRYAYSIQIEASRESIEAGDGDALLDAVRDACLGKMEMPDWLAARVIRAIRRYTHYEVRTLDEAFCVKKRVKFAARQKKLQHGLKIYLEVCALNSVDISITQELFSAIGKLHGMDDWKTVMKLYSEEKKRRGGRMLSRTDGDPNKLPAHLLAIYESMPKKTSGKRIPPSS